MGYLIKGTTTNWEVVVGLEVSDSFRTVRLATSCRQGGVQNHGVISYGCMSACC